MTDETHPVVRQAVSTFNGIIGWIGASIAGLTALCYGAGYFVIHTHLAMLGFSGIVDVPTNQLLLEGGRFFFYTLEKILLAGMVIVLIPTGLYLLGRSVHHIPPIHRHRAVVGLRRILAGDRAQRIGSYALPLLAIVLVVWHFNYYYDAVGTLQRLSNLAFVPAEVPGFAAEVVPLITSGSEKDRDILIATYLQFVFNYTAFISALWIVIYRAGSTPLGKIAKGFFILYTALLTVSLPLAFGILVRTPLYPATIVTLKMGAPVKGLMLQRSEHSVLLWRPDERRAVSLEAGEISRIESMGELDIFQKE